MTSRHPTRRLFTTGLTAAVAAPAILRTTGARAAGKKIRVLTNWFAEAEHGAFYQGVATGAYAKAGLDVELMQGGPQLNSMQLIAGGETDVAMSYDIQILSSLEKGIPIKAIFTCFQFDLIGLMTRPDVKSLADLKGRKVFFGASGYATYWPWLKKKFGYTDEMAAPKGINLQGFLQDPTSAVAGYYTAEPYVAKQAGMETKFFLFAKDDYPPYANTMITTNSFLAANQDALAAFTRVTQECWKDYLANPTAGNDYIKKQNPKMDDAQINFTLEKMAEVKAIEGGEAATKGIGTMSEDRWKKTYDFLVESQLLKPEVKWRDAFTLDFIKDVKVTI